MEIETSSSTECDKVLSKLQFYLEKHRLKDIEQLIDDHVWNEIEEDMESKWNMVILISSRLKTLNKYRFKTFEVCQNLLIESANRCNAKEMLLAFLAELENAAYEQESSDDSVEDGQSNDDQSSPRKSTKSSFDNCIKSFFTPLKIVINKMPKQKEDNLKWVLGILNCYLLKISIPNQHKSDEQSIDLINSSKPDEFNELNYTTSLERFDFLLPDYLNFLSEFVDQYANEDYRSISAKYLNGKLTLIKALLSMLHHPFMYLDLSEPIQAATTNNKGSTMNLDKDIIGLTNTKDNLLSELKGVKCFKQNSQIYSFQIVNLISRLEANIFELYDLQQLICRVDENSNLKLGDDLVKYSFGVQAYIVYVLLNENLTFVPLIYSPIYAFRQHIAYVIALLERSEPFVCEKGIKLVEKLIFKIPDLSLKSNFLDYLREHPLDRTLIKVMRFSANEQHRRTAFNVYRKLITILDGKGRYNFIYKTSAEPNQYSGIRGLMITIYKDFLLNKEQNQEFVGSNLQNYLRLIVDLVNLVQEEFDLIENMDLLMSLLNFVRFLLIWDKKTINETGVFNELKLIDDFSSKLKKKIEFGRNFLKMKINSAKSGKNTKKKKKKAFAFDISCANGDDNLTDLFNSMSEKDEINMYKQGLANVDMMDSVLARVNELISNCK